MSAWLAAGFDDRQQCFDAAAAGCAVGARGEFAPADRVTQRAFGAVVGRFDPGDFGEQPELIEVCQQVVTPRDGRGVRAPLPVFQGVLELRPAMPLDQISQRVVSAATGSIALPEFARLLP